MKVSTAESLRLTISVCLSLSLSVCLSVCLSAGNMPCDIDADYQKLLSTVKIHFPAANVAAAAIPSQAKWRCNDTIAALNKGLGNLCVSNSNKVHFMRLSTCWQCCRQGKVDPGILTDKVHLSVKGLSELRSCVKSRGGRPGLPSLINLRFLWT